MTIRVKDTIDSPTSRTISNSQYRAINFNDNYPCTVKFIDEKNNINAVVYDHSFSIETGFKNVSQSQPSCTVEIYDNSNNKLLQSLTYPNSSTNPKLYIYETQTTVPSKLKIKIKRSNENYDSYYSTISVVDKTANSLLYARWGKNTTHEFTITPVWGRHMTLEITQEDKFVQMTEDAIRFYRGSGFSPVVNFQPYSGVEIYQMDEANPDNIPTKWNGATLWSSDNYVRFPKLFLTQDGYDNFDDTMDYFMTLYTYNISDIKQGMTITNSSDMQDIAQKNSKYELQTADSSGLSWGFGQNLDITLPNSASGDSEGVGYYIEKTQTPLYSILFSNVKVKKYGASSYNVISQGTTKNRAIFDSSSFDIQIDPSNISASGSTVRRFSSSGLRFNNTNYTTLYQDANVINPYGNITASDHYATISGDTYSLAGDIYGQVITGGSGNWTVRIYNNSPVDIRCQYYSKKTKENETTFDKTITVSARSSSGNITLQDQAWYDDKWFRVQATGWASTIGGRITTVYGAVKKIPDDNSKGYLY